MNNVLLYLGGLLAVALAALFAVPNFVDWNGYRGVFEEEASKVLGRDVRVGGAVNLRLLPVPYVRFEKVRLADLTGQTGEPFMRAESFTMWLALPPLLRGVFEANEIELNKPVLTLALDGKGGGNWTSIELKSGDLPFVPHDLALHSVKLIDGAITVYGADAKPVARVDRIDGELSADSLRGPFKFKGGAQWSAARHDIKFVTTLPDPDGSFRIKATTHVENSPNTFTLDGKVEDFSVRPHLSGELTAKLAVPRLDAKSASAKVPDASVFDFKSQVAADATGAKFEDIALAVDNVAEPQLIAGRATAAWVQEPRLDLELFSKWLDLDRLAGAGQDSAPFSNIKTLVVGLMSAVAGDGAASAKINLEQVKLGGETAGGLKIDAERSGGVVRIKELKAGLPGGSRLDLMGELKDDGGAFNFAGHGFVRGTSLSRLRSWAEKSGATIDVQADGPFSAEGRLLLSTTRLELVEASGFIAGHPVSGDLKVIDEGHRRIEVTLESARLDSHEFFPNTAAALETAIRKALGLVATQVASQARSSDAVKLAPLGDFSLRVLAGEVRHGDQSFRNVDVTVGSENGEVRVPAAKFVTAGGLAVAIDGRVKTAQDDPKGAFAYDLVGTTPDAIKDLIGFIGFDGVVDQGRLAAVGSAKIAGLVRLGARGKASADVSIDGTLNGSQVTGFGEFDDGLQNWRTAPSRLHVAVNAPALGVLLSSLGRGDRSVSDSVAQPANASITSSGIVASGAAARAQISAPGLDTVFEGRFSLAEGRQLTADGQVDFKAHDFADVLVLLGLPAINGTSNVATDGSIVVARSDDGSWSLTSNRLVLGTSTLNGDVKISNDANGQRNIAADISADRLTVARLLGAVTDKSVASAAGVPTDGDLEGPAADHAVWPDGPFNFASLGDAHGEIKLRFQSLELSGGLVARNGAAKITFAPRQIMLSDLHASAAGGQLESALSLDKAADAVALVGSIKMDDVALSAFSNTAKGKGRLELTANARAQSPAALMAVLAGTGTVWLQDAELPGPNAKVATGIIDGVLANKIANEPAALTDAFLTASSSSHLTLGTRQVGLKISDGVVKFDPIAFDTADGQMSASTALEALPLAVKTTLQLTPII